jgi:hypothetical protein
VASSNTHDTRAYRLCEDLGLLPRYPALSPEEILDLLEIEPPEEDPQLEAGALKALEGRRPAPRRCPRHDTPEPLGSLGCPNCAREAADERPTPGKEPH